MKNVIGLLIIFAGLLSGCATVQPKDYTEFRKSHPRSILVLPPVNETTEVWASYSVLTTTTRPLAELGYYVLPVVMVDHFMRENGLSSAAEMQQVPLNKLYEAFGADSVLYITVEKYGSKYQILSSGVYVYARAKLVDARTGANLWEGRVQMTYNGQSGLLEALVEQVMNKLFDQAHSVAAMASYQLLTVPGQGMPKGPRHSDYGKD